MESEKGKNNFLKKHGLCAVRLPERPCGRLAAGRVIACFLLAPEGVCEAGHLRRTVTRPASHRHPSRIVSYRSITTNACCVPPGLEAHGEASGEASTCQDRLLGQPSPLVGEGGLACHQGNSSEAAPAPTAKSTHACNRMGCGQSSRGFSRLKGIKVRVRPEPFVYSVPLSAGLLVKDPVLPSGAVWLDFCKDFVFPLSSPGCFPLWPAFPEAQGESAALPAGLSHAE